METWSAADAARWLAEAIETGNPLAPLPDGIAPRSLAEAEDAASATLDALGLAPCGLRLLRHDDTTLAGPMLEARLVPGGTQVAAASLRHPRVTAAAIGVLGEALDADGGGPPVLARLHPALDISSTRFGEATEDRLALTADLARLGLVVAGKGKAVAPGPLRVALMPAGMSSRGAEVDLAEGFAQAAAAARAWGGLPAGALLIVAGLTPARAAEGKLRASLGALGRVEATFTT